MNWPLVITLLLAGLVIGVLLYTRLIKWAISYIPSLNVARLSREMALAHGELTTQIILAKEASASVSADAARLTTILDDIEFSRSMIVEIMKSQALKQLGSLSPLIVEKISREVSAQVARALGDTFATKAASYRSEYVHIASLDELSFEIDLRADGYHSGELKQAMAKALASSNIRGGVPKHPKEAEAFFLQAFKDDKDFALLLGSFGEHLFNLRWVGLAQVQRKHRGSSDRSTDRLEVPYTPSSVVSYGYEPSV